MDIFFSLSSPVRVSSSDGWLVGRGRSPERYDSKERQTRTLFVRNVSYSIQEKQMKELFAKYGELKRFFNLIEKRGMAFVTYVSNHCLS
jgi:RNA recognition motif-containing protein